MESESSQVITGAWRGVDCDYHPMSTLICRTCKATDFGEGNVGELVCNVCGTELVIGTNDRTEANFAALGAKIYQAKKSKAFVPSADQGNLNNSSRGTSRRKRRKAVASATNLPRTDGMYKQELVGSIHSVNSGATAATTATATTATATKYVQTSKHEEILKGYQWCLRDMLGALQKEHIISTNVAQQVRSIWFCYLEEIWTRNVPLKSVIYRLTS